MTNFKLGINLGWFGEELSIREIEEQYYQWLDICQKHDIKVVRIFLVQWSINALFKSEMLDLFIRISYYANNKSIEIIPVLNHYTDFVKIYQQDFHNDKYTWKNYDLKKKRIKDFFKKIDNSYIEKIDLFFEAIASCSNIKQIELFNELNKTAVTKTLQINWINVLYEHLTTKTNNKYKFIVSISNYSEINYYKKKIKFKIDIHCYSYPYSFSIKNMEILNHKHQTCFLFAEYGKYSDFSYLEQVDAINYFAAGLWGSRLMGHDYSPFHWWWEDLLNSEKYLRVIDIFNNYSLNIDEFHLFKTYSCNIISFKKQNTVSKLDNNKALRRFKLIIRNPFSVFYEYRAFLKYIRKNILNFISKDMYYTIGFAKNNQSIIFLETSGYYCIKLKIKLSTSIKFTNVVLLDIISGKTKKIGINIQNEFKIEILNSHLLFIS